MFGRQRIQHCDDLGLCQIGDGDGFDHRSPVGGEASTVQVDEHAVLLLCRNGQRCHDLHRHARDRVVRNIYRVHFANLLAAILLPAGGLRTIFRQIVWRLGIRHRLGGEHPRLGADGVRHGNDACHMRGSMVVDEAGIAPRRSPLKGRILGPSPPSGEQDETQDQPSSSAIQQAILLLPTEAANL